MAAGADFPALPPSLGRLPRPWAKFCLRVERFCLDVLRLDKGARILLAISGGADSTAMAAIFSILAARLEMDLLALHVNHNLRANAIDDERFSLRLCSFLGISARAAFLDTRALAQKEGRGLEDAARLGRHRLLEKARAEADADYIATAHHMGDLCEDMLLRLMRGAGWPALGGMLEKDDKRRLIRPLLRQSPQKLRAFLGAAGLPWREDESNASPLFKRNRTRHAIMPLLRGENPNIERAFGDLHEIAALDGDYWNELLDSALERHPWLIEGKGCEIRIRLGAELLAPLHPAARLRLFHKCLLRMRDEGGICCQARARTLFGLEAAYAAKRGDALFEFPGGVAAEILGKNIIFTARGLENGRKG